MNENILFIDRANNKLSWGKWLTLLLLPILSWGCFWYVNIPHDLEKALALVSSVLLLIFFFIKEIRRINNKEASESYEKSLRIFIFLSFISIINAWLYWGQQPWWTFSAGYGIYIYIYYFVLKQFHVSQKQLFKVQAIFAVIYTLLWIYAISKAPDVVFGSEEEIGDDRGFFRISLLGFDFICLFYYYSIVRYLNNLRSVKWLILTVLSFLIMFASLSRMVIATMVICTFFYVIHKRSFKLILLVVVFLSLSYGSIMQNEIVENMIEINERQTDSESDGLIRSEWGDSFKLFPFHVGTFLFGNGQDHVASSYGKLSEQWKDQYSFNRSDVGYPGFYVTYGLIPLLLLLLLFYRMILQKVPEEYYYYKLYIIHFLIASLTTYYFVFWGASLMMAVYSLDCLKKCNTIKKSVHLPDNLS